MAHAPAADSIFDLIQARAAADPAGTAIAAEDRPSLSYSALSANMLATVAALRSAGIRRNDRVAIVLPNGPEMATAFLGVAAGATSAPLNPGYTRAECAFYLEDLGARALIVRAGSESPAREAAVEASVPIIELLPGDEAGSFTLVAPANPAVSGETDFEMAPCDDVALVLHTSGTTSRPKQVPLTHANVTASARHIAAALQLTDRDACLNVMPLFHIHGLIGALLSSMTAGGRVICTPGPAIPDMLTWIDDLAPTWYSAVPTMHHAVVTAARVQPPRHNLRFIRSSSSALPRRTLASLESLFGVPVIEAYGMTEASHQMASNPLPPRERKAGSVGVAAGPEIAIMNERGDLLAPGETGEVVIRGPNVTSGYASNPAANASTFTNGWFRTGDQGYMDADGYLFLNGRLKELINRGGEKISPVEIDEALLEHPAIAQALAFAIPHPTLGEDVGAAVVLRPSQSVTERQIRQFASAKLALFKVPRRVVVLDAIPKGPTGKPQRIGLHARLGLDVPSDVAREDEVAAGPVHEIVAALWTEVLGASPATMRTSFFEAGGDSLLASQLVARVIAALDVELTLLELFDGPSVAEVAELVNSRLAGDAPASAVPA